MNPVSLSFGQNCAAIIGAGARLFVGVAAVLPAALPAHGARAQAPAELVKDITAGLGSTSFSFLTNGNGTLFFSADDGLHGRELWISDGTAAGTMLVKDIDASTSSSYY